MRSHTWRWAVGTLILLVAAVYVSAWINSDVDGGDYWGMQPAQALTLWSAGFVAGCIVREWRAVLLALLPIVVAIPFGLKGDGGGFIDPRPVALYLAVLAPVCAVAIGAGVGITGAMWKFVRRRAVA